MEEKKYPTLENITVSEISDADWKKIKNDLRFISLMTTLSKEHVCRLIVSGGYAVDGSLGKITRPHRDIDMQIFGRENESGLLIRQLITRVKEEVPELPDLEVKDKGRQEFYHSYFIQGNGLGSDIYYVQVAGNPFDKEKYVVKKDGSQTERQEYETVLVTLEGTTFEAVGPTSELVDKIYKREVKKERSKAEHEQDIANLRLITDSEEVKARLEVMK